MYLCYVDESGDTGLAFGCSSHFVLTGLVVHELRWIETLNRMLSFRKLLRDRYGFSIGDEIHSAQLLSQRAVDTRLGKSLRLRMLGEVPSFTATLESVSIINVVVSKSGKPRDFDVFQVAWKTLVQCFHAGVYRRDFNGPANPEERGMFFVDRTDEERLRRITRQLNNRENEPSPRSFSSSSAAQLLLIDDPVHRESDYSYFIQHCDVVAYFLKQWLSPSSFVQKKGARHWFARVERVLYKPALIDNRYGILER